MRLTPVHFSLFPAIVLFFAGTSNAQSDSRQSSSVTFDSIVSDVLSSNPEIAFYEAEIEATRASSSAASTRDNPELSVEFGRKRVTDSTGTLAGEGNAWSVSLSQTFEWPGRLALRKAVANRDVALAELGLERFKTALASRARALAHGLHAAQVRADAAAEVAARYAALRELFVARDPGGITPLLETRVIEAQELALQKRATDASLALLAALVELNQLRGLAADTPLSISAGSAPRPMLPELPAALDAARENNFELRAAQIELEQQGFAVSLARHDGRPAITVSPFLSEERAADTERTYGLGISIPLPVNGRSRASTAAAEARQLQARTAASVAQRDVERDVILAVHKLGEKLAESERWDPESSKRFREAAELADRHFRLGAVPISTYVELQGAYLDAIDALQETEREIIEAAAEVERLTGLHVLQTGEAAR